MDKDEILSEIKEALYPNLMKEQVLLLSPKLLNELFRDELEQKFNGDYLLDKRAFNTLDSLNIKTMKDLQETTRLELLGVYGCGRRTWCRIYGFQSHIEQTWFYVSNSKIEELLPMWSKMIGTMNNYIQRLNDRVLTGIK
tara:strand:+ start:3553 stop:3972 length:420 start_codon:yes stop_codon:yes gene_type:complete